jgi:hypothetical protein
MLPLNLFTFKRSLALLFTYVNLSSHTLLPLNLFRFFVSWIKLKLKSELLPKAWKLFYWSHGNNIGWCLASPYLKRFQIFSQLNNSDGNSIFYSRVCFYDFPHYSLFVSLKMTNTRQVFHLLNYSYATLLYLYNITLSSLILLAT